METPFLGGLGAMATNKASQRRYPPEMRERAVRMVRAAIGEAGGERYGVVGRVAKQLGIGTESLRAWVNQVEVDKGQRPGVAPEDRRRIAELEKEVRELRRPARDPNAGDAFFAREAAPPVARRGASYPSARRGWARCR